MRRASKFLGALAALRLTRFVTRDSLGAWLILDPAEGWAKRHEGAVNAETGGVVSAQSKIIHFDELLVDPDLGWRSKLVSGLSCPHCIGFWITVGTLAAGSIADKSPKTAKLFNVTAGSLGLSYVIGHVSQRLDS